MLCNKEGACIEAARANGLAGGLGAPNGFACVGRRNVSACCGGDSRWVAAKQRTQPGWGEGGTGL